MVMTMITNGDSYCNLHPDNKGVNHVILFLFYSYLFFINFTKIALHYHYPCPLFHWPRGGIFEDRNNCDDDDDYKW